MRRHTGAGGALGLLAVGLGVIALSGSKRAAAASSGGNLQVSPWTVLPKAQTIQFDPARQYALLVMLSPEQAATATAAEVEAQFTSKIDIAQSQTWDDPADIPYVVRQAFSEDDLRPMPGRYWLFLHPRERKAYAWGSSLLRVHVRQARPA